MERNRGELELEDELYLATEVDKNISESGRDGRRRVFLSVSVIIIFVVTIFSLQYLRASTGLMVSVTIAVATVCLVWIVNRGLMLMDIRLTGITVAIEFFGRKQLEGDRKGK